jgi:outer membrane immunogenic protein
MQRKFLASVALASMMAGSAFAADMPLKAVAPVAMYDWSGMYIGGVIGGAWSTNDIADPSLGVVNALLGVPYTTSVTSSSFIGGVEAGSRYQFGKLVIGYEGDITWGSLNGTNTVGVAPLGLININRTLTADTNWTATAVSTVGIAHNNWLLYGKAGVAWANTSYTNTYSAAGIGNVFTGTGSDTRTGWTVGTGLEWGLWNNWSVKVEYDYLDFGAHNINTPGSVLGVVGITPGLQDNNHISEVKAGLNWKVMPNFW